MPKAHNPNNGRERAGLEGRNDVLKKGSSRSSKITQGEKDGASARLRT